MHCDAVFVNCIVDCIARPKANFQPRLDNKVQLNKKMTHWTFKILHSVTQKQLVIAPPHVNASRTPAITH